VDGRHWLWFCPACSAQEPFDVGQPYLYCAPSTVLRRRALHHKVSWYSSRSSGNRFDTYKERVKFPVGTSMERVGLHPPVYGHQLHSFPYHSRPAEVMKMMATFGMAFDQRSSGQKMKMSTNELARPHTLSHVWNT
jgi:hypothetical protein